MAYEKRKLYTVCDDLDLKTELLELLYEKEDVSSIKARQLVYYPTPMSLIRWGKWLSPIEIDKYLVEYEDDNEDDIEYNDLGI